MSYSPTITLVVARFDLSKEERITLDSLLRTNHSPSISHKRGTTRITPALNNKMQALVAERDRIHALGDRWLGRNLPGVFFRERQGRLPHLDLILTKAADPQELRADNYDYMRMLDLAQLFGSWRCVEFPGLSLHRRYTPDRIRDGFGEYTLSARIDSALPDETIKSFGHDRSPEAISWILDLYGAPSMLGVLSITELLRVKEAATAQTRDRAYSTHGGSRTIRSNRRLRESILSASLDVSAVAGDLSGYGPEKVHRSADWDLLHFKPIQSTVDVDNPPDEGPEMWETICAGHTNSARELYHADEQIRSIIGTAASVSATIANMRLQRWALAVATISALLAILALIVAASTFNADGLARLLDGL